MSKFDRLHALDALERLSYRDKLNHWRGRTPWAAVTLFNKVAIKGNDVTVVGGDVKRMPRLSGRPCFGIPTAWLMHGHTPTIASNKLVKQPTCQRCKVRYGCEMVAEQRLSATPELRGALGEFRGSGGVRMARDSSRGAFRALGKLTRLLNERGPFENVNDEYALNALEQAMIAEREKDRDKKEKTRSAAKQAELEAGHLSEDIIQQLNIHRLFRLTIYDHYRGMLGAHRSVTAGPPSNGELTAEVWFSKAILELRSKAPTAYAIARLMMERGNAFGLGHASLRDRVGSALRRVELLETTVMPNGTDAIWPRLGRRQLLDEVALRANANMP